MSAKRTCLCCTTPVPPGHDFCVLHFRKISPETKRQYFKAYYAQKRRTLSYEAWQAVKSQAIKEAKANA